MERFPHPQSPESSPSLRYAEGWREILEAPDAADYQLWMGELAGMTYRMSHELTEIPVWTEDIDSIIHRWQRAIEIVADAAITPDDMNDLTQAQIIETALLTLQANLEGMGWDEEGFVFTVPNIFTGEAAIIDLRELSDE